MNKFICLFVFWVSVAHAKNVTPRIAIIGGGIGGTTSSYYLRNLFGDDAVIDLYEPGDIGGRLATIELGGRSYESGGSILHPTNFYMVNFTQMLGLKARDKSSGVLGIYDGKQMVFQCSHYDVITMAKLIWRYGLDFIRINTIVTDMQKDFSSIYESQDSGNCFTRVEKLIESMSPSFLEYMQMSMDDNLKSKGFSDIFIDEIVRGALRANYGQDVDIQAFVASVSIAGVQPGLWSVHGGNKLIAERLVETAMVKLHRVKVTEVINTGQPQEPQFVVHTVDSNNNKHKEIYDIVVIATPLNDNQSQINFKNFAADIFEFQQSYHQTVATFIQGMPNISTFGLNNVNDFPSALLTSNPDLFFNSIGLHKTVDYVSSDENSGDAQDAIYKVFSKKPLSEQQLDELFSERKDMKVVTWSGAYPEYSSCERKFPAFELAPQLYYVNGIEFAASVAEISAIGGRNVALLAFNKWQGWLEYVDPVSDHDSMDRQEL